MVALSAPQRRAVLVLHQRVPVSTDISGACVAQGPGTWQLARKRGPRAVGKLTCGTRIQAGVTLHSCPRSTSRCTRARWDDSPHQPQVHRSSGIPPILRRLLDSQVVVLPNSVGARVQTRARVREGRCGFAAQGRAGLSRLPLPFQVSAGNTRCKRRVETGVGTWRV